MRGLDFTPPATINAPNQAVPCHCHLLAEAAERFRVDVEKTSFNPFASPVVPNCDPGLFYSRDNAAQLLARQMVRGMRGPSAHAGISPAPLEGGETAGHLWP